MATESGLGTNQGISALVEEARQLRRLQSFDTGIAVSALVVVTTIQISHNIFSIPRVEPFESTVQLAFLVDGLLASFRGIACSFQGQYLDFRAIAIKLEEVSKRPPTLS